MTLADDPTTWPETVGTLGFLIFVGFIFWVLFRE